MATHVAPCSQSRLSAQLLLLLELLRLTMLVALALAIAVLVVVAVVVVPCSAIGVSQCRPVYRGPHRHAPVSCCTHTRAHNNSSPLSTSSLSHHVLAIVTHQKLSTSPQSNELT